MHGVNLMYKIAPYEITTSGTGKNVLKPAEARRIASLGFDVVRLGVFWKGLEPGSAQMNDPSICRPGKPGTSGPAQFRRALFERYVSRLDATISLLAHYGIYSLIDMHQDDWNEVFAGEGAPNWAVCTDGITPVAHRNVPDWSVNGVDPGIKQALDHFWQNDVVGNLQGAYDDLWGRIAAHFRGNRWVVGYDPINEPYSVGIVPPGNSAPFDAEVQCFYAGRDNPGLTSSGQHITCPPDDPALGVIPRIQEADPGHLVFYEPDTTTSAGTINYIGPMPFHNLVLNFHDYCFLHVPNGPEPPDYGSVCPSLENLVFKKEGDTANHDSVTEQTGGPALFLSEFGATTDAADLARIASEADTHLVGWMYWQWLRYDDPTGSHNSGLWPPGPSTAAQLKALSRAYAQAIAGTPTTTSFDPSTGAFHLTYLANPAVRAPTVVFLPLSLHYPQGYCARVSGGRVTSRPGSQRLLVQNMEGATTVTVSVVGGHCGTAGS